MSTPVVGPQQRGNVNNNDNNNRVPRNNRVVRGGNRGDDNLLQGHLQDYWTVAGSVRGLPREESDVLVEREQATVADSVPLGLAGFAAATFVIGTAYCGWFGIAAAFVAIPVALVFGGIGQFLAGMWAFRRGNVLGATAFSTFGAFNASWAILEWMLVTHFFPATVIAVASGGTLLMGTYILMFSLISLYLGVAALGENTMIAAILFVLCFTYLALGTGIWVGGDNWITVIGGYAAIIVACMAFYESAAVVINSGMRHEVLPAFNVTHSRFFTANNTTPTTNTAPANS